MLGGIMFDFFNCLVLFRHSFLPTYFIPLNKWIMLKCPFKDCGDTVRCFSRKTATAEEHWGKADKAAIRHKKAFHLAGEVFCFVFPAVELCSMFTVQVWPRRERLGVGVVLQDVALHTSESSANVSVRALSARCLPTICTLYIWFHIHALKVTVWPFEQL